MPYSRGRGNRSYRKRVTTIAVSIGSLVVVLVAQLAVVGTMLWPQVFAQIQGFWRSNVLGAIDAVCGCTAVATAANTRYTTAGFVIVILALVWAAFSVRRVVQYVRQTSQAQKRMQALGIGQRSQMSGVSIIVVNDTALQAVTIGWLRPVVYVSEGLIAHLTPFELLAVLQHEVSHAKHRDPMWRAVISVALPFLGLQSRIIQHIEAWQEIAADEAANPTTLQQAFLSITSRISNSRSSNSLSEDELIAHSSFAMQQNAAVNVRLQHWLGESVTLGPIRWLLAAVIVGIALITTLQIAVASTESHQLVQSCLELQAMCEEVMSRPPMTLRQ